MTGSSRVRGVQPSWRYGLGAVAGVGWLLTIGMLMSFYSSMPEWANCGIVCPCYAECQRVSPHAVGQYECRVELVCPDENRVTIKDRVFWDGPTVPRSDERRRCSTRSDSRTHQLRPSAHDPRRYTTVRIMDDAEQHQPDPVPDPMMCDVVAAWMAVWMFVMVIFTTLVCAA